MNQPVSADSEYFVRHRQLTWFGLFGQKRVSQAKVLIVGAGGLGVSVAMNLAASGIGQLTLIDGDSVQASNLHRQLIYSTADIGKSKTAVCQQKLRQAYPYVEICGIQGFLTSQSARPLITSHTITIDATDCLETKYLLNDTVLKAGSVLVQAAISQCEGRLHVVRRGLACLRCLWPSPQKALGCHELGVLGAYVTALGAMQAAEVLKILTAQDLALTDYLIFDFMQYNCSRLKKSPRHGCLCQSFPEGKALQKSTLTPKVVSYHEIAHQLTEFDMIDIRETSECRTEVLAENLQVRRIPLSHFDPHRDLSHPTCKTLLICQHGLRSLRLAQRLSEQGFTEVYSLADGLQSI